nr:NINE protein [Mycobacterium persicum]
MRAEPPGSVKSAIGNGEAVMSIPNEPRDPSSEPPWGEQPHGYGPPPNPHVPSQWGYPGQPQPANPAYPHPGFPGYHPAGNPYAPYGHDAASGVPLSDKSAVTAGLLQLFFGFLGIGRFYIGSIPIAVTQLSLGLLGIVLTMFCLVGFPILVGVVVWTFVDAIMMFTGSVTDEYGRKLR